MNGSVLEEMGEEEHFTAKGKAGAQVKELETEFLGVAGGVLDGGQATPDVTSRGEP